MYDEFYPPTIDQDQLAKGKFVLEFVCKRYVCSPNLSGSLRVC